MSINQQETILKGNELGWILKLAERHLASEQFQNYLSYYHLDNLRSFLYETMGRFRETNFYVGDSRITWVLIRKEEV